jgi:hypothetical protein
MATDKEIRYHRSFLVSNYWDFFDKGKPLSQARLERVHQEAEISWWQRNDPRHFEELRKSLAFASGVKYVEGRVPPDEKVVECLVPVVPWQGVVARPEGGIALPIPYFRIQAYRRVHGSVRPLQVLPKTDQLFETYATPWEKTWSDLISSVNLGFAPIVDETLMVVGHMGPVSGGHFTKLIVPRSAVPGGSTDDLGEILNDGVPVFVHDRDKAKPPDGWLPLDVRTTEHRHTVRTTIDGEVLEWFSGGSTGFVESVNVTPLDLVSGGFVLTQLGRAIGVRVVKSLLRKVATGASRQVLEGATVTLAKEVEGKIAQKLAARPPLPAGIISAEGQLPLVRIGRLGQPGNLNGYIRVVGDEVSYKVEAIVFDGATTAAEEGAVQLARQAHREMLVRTAKEAQKHGQKRFTLFGESTNEAFRARADDLARKVGVPGSGKRFSGALPDRPNYEVVLDVEKVLKSNP